MIVLALHKMDRHNVRLIFHLFGERKIVWHIPGNICVRILVMKSSVIKIEKNKLSQQRSVMRERLFTLAVRNYFLSSIFSIIGRVFL